MVIVPFLERTGQDMSSAEEQGYQGRAGSGVAALAVAEHTFAELVYGHPVEPKGKPGRQCRRCQCILSIYNPNELCHVCDKPH